MLVWQTLHQLSHLGVPGWAHLLKVPKPPKITPLAEHQAFIHESVRDTSNSNPASGSALSVVSRRGWVGGP